MDFFKARKINYSIIGIVIVVLIVGVGLLWFLKQNSSESSANEIFEETLGTTTSTTKEKETEIEEIFVDIKGAVKKPGVYQLKSAARVFEGIEAAGGFLETADLKRVNQAKLLEDQGQLYIPEIGEEIDLENELEEDISSKDEKSSGKININKEEVSKLQELPGIGAKKAQAIVDYRKENGSFKTIEELMEVSGIGEGTFTKLKELITIK